GNVLKQGWFRLSGKCADSTSCQCLVNVLGFPEKQEAAIHLCGMRVGTLFDGRAIGCGKTANLREQPNFREQPWRCIKSIRKVEDWRRSIRSGIACALRPKTS